MSLRDDFQRVSCEYPCPVCGRPDWCMISRDDPRNPSRVICQREKSGRRWGEAGWLHRFGDGQRRPPQSVRPRLSYRQPSRHFGPIAAECRRAIQPDRLQALADDLGLSVVSLQRLGIGWSSAYRAWTFPMFAAACGVLRVDGIRVRRPNGDKLAMTGSRNGLFIPGGMDRHEDAQPIGAIIARDNPLFICEGPTDTAAMLDLGFHAIGRPSCSGGTAHVVALIASMRSPDVVLMADADVPGQRGAAALAKTLAARGVAVSVLTPPSEYKDVRAWKQSGLLAGAITALIESGVDHGDQ